MPRKNLQTLALHTQRRHASVGAAVAVRDSPVHGRGVFATAAISQGARIIEYLGEIISWKEALRRHPHDPSQPHHTFYFHINSRRVIDAAHQGNDARWINHSCAPNCEAQEQKGRIFIVALRAIAAGEELNYDYGLTIDEPISAELLRNYPCRCGSANCRGTLLKFSDTEVDLANDDG